LVSNFAFYLTRRAINALVTIILLLALIFGLIHSILRNPISLARIYLASPHATNAQLEHVVAQYGLAEPIPVQFWNYIVGVFQGNLGYDPTYHVEETFELHQYLPVTLELVIIANIVAVLIGIYTGAIAAANRNRTADYGIKAIYLVTWSTPAFLVGFIGLLIFSYWWGLLPSSGVYNQYLTAPPSVTGAPLIDGLIAGDWTFLYSVLQHLVLPVMSIAIASFGLITRITRASMIDALDRDYVKLAYMKGLSKNKVVWGTAFRNAIIPIITLVALVFAFSASGAVIIEDVFNYHGMGWFSVNAIFNFDFTAIYAFTIIIGISVVAANLAADVLYAIADPRVRLT
jgi:peptide/nickel transport system permease protein